MICVTEKTTVTYLLDAVFTVYASRFLQVLGCFKTTAFWIIPEKTSAKQHKIKVQREMREHWITSENWSSAEWRDAT